MRNAARTRLELQDWKRRVFELYAAVRADPDPVAAWDHWRSTRDALFRGHSQTPLPVDARTAFEQLDYFPYDATLRVLGAVEDAPVSGLEIGTSTGEDVRVEGVGRVRFELDGEAHALDLYWVAGYGGGLFLPFADETSGSETYGGGRYLIDAVKGADLGADGDGLVLDFNFAYNPSCAYDPQWSCPLAPAANRLAVRVEGGERRPRAS